MEIEILQLAEGAKKAEGLNVIIDVFRAFTLECYMMAAGAERILPIGDIEEAYRRKREFPECILVGERGGKICEGFDYGNSPSQLKNAQLSGKTVLHTTSAGTQGIAGAAQADRILGAALVNAKATADYIKKCRPQKVSLVAMGKAGIEEAKEDLLCARYIKSLLLDESFPIKALADGLKEDGGEHFFVPECQDVFPEEDFYMCIEVDKFPFALELCRQEQGCLAMEKRDS